MEYGAEIRNLRKKAGLSQENLAQQAGIDRANLNRIEAGNRACSESMFEHLIGVLGYRLEKKIKKKAK